MSTPSAPLACTPTAGQRHADHVPAKLLRNSVTRPARSSPSSVASVILLLLIYVFGGTLGAGLSVVGTRSDYLAYITPAIVVMGAVGIMQMIAVWIAMDMSEGIIARFRTMAIARSSVLAGHASSGIVLVVVSTVPLLGFAVLLGCCPHADGLQWLALPGLVLLIGIALSWLTVAFDLATRRVGTPAPSLACSHPADGEQRLRPRELVPRLDARIRRVPALHPILNTIRDARRHPGCRHAAWAVGWLSRPRRRYVWCMWLSGAAPPAMARETGNCRDA